jgi:hypothetical protein
MADSLPSELIASRPMIDEKHEVFFLLHPCELLFLHDVLILSHHRLYANYLRKEKPGCIPLAVG